MSSVQTIGPVIIATSVTSQATALCGSSLGVRTSTFAFQNNGTGSVYLGASNVSSTAGFVVQSGETLILGEQEIRTAREKFDPGNYYAMIPAASTAACILFYNEILARR